MADTPREQAELQKAVNTLGYEFVHSPYLIGDTRARRMRIEAAFRIRRLDRAKHHNSKRK